MTKRRREDCRIVQGQDVMLRLMCEVWSRSFGEDLIFIGVRMPDDSVRWATRLALDDETGHALENGLNRVLLELELARKG
jgi:hypothetical protein